MYHIYLNIRFIYVLLFLSSANSFIKEDNFSTEIVTLPGTNVTNSYVTFTRIKLINVYLHVYHFVAWLYKQTTLGHIHSLKTLIPATIGRKVCS